MKHGKMTKWIAVVLVCCMSLSIAMPAGAAGRLTGGSRYTDQWKSFWEDFFGSISAGSNGNTDSGTNTDDGNTDSGSDTGNTGDSNGVMTLVEDDTTVSEGTALRASTYVLNNNATTYAGSTPTTTLKYFPVTLYNYDKTTINNATHQAEVDGGLDDNTWNGIYFNDGNPGEESYAYTTSSGAHTDLTWAQVQNGTYYSDEACTISVSCNPQTESTYTQASVTCNTLISSNKDSWTACTGYYYTPDGNNYYPLYAMRSKSRWTYYTWGYSTTSSTSNVTQIGTQSTTNTSTTPNITVYEQTTVTTGYQLMAGSSVIANLNSTDTTQKVGVTLYTKGGSGTTSSLPYADWNHWDKSYQNKQNDYGQYTYSGLVESTLTANKDITFTKPDGGIFNSDATVKDIYTGVEMPFVYVNGTYTFDASQNGVYFYADSTQGSTTAQSNGRLYFNEGKPQSNGGNYGDGSTTVWMPFNSAQSINGEAYCDYHFGMRTTIPFTMTANGRMNPNNNASEAITFSFSGDDDVWIFIDGQLIIDLGGIHNRLDATINFAENTWSISESNTSDVAVADYNGAAISGKIFDIDDTTGELNQTRETFAATDSHELTIFYLERGAGSSNCKIQFNLPMKDTLSVKKLVRETDSEDKALDADTLAQINNRDFGFTLYKDGSPVANVNYSLLNENGQYISTPSTDANGHFHLKNGQTAKFVGEINSNSYYVVEDKDADADSFWQVPNWTYTAEVANGTTSTDSTIDGQSMTVTANGSGEAEDSIVFTCTNIWKHQNKTSISAVDDKIVIDYGLSVVIDVLANDTVSNGTKSIESVTDAQYGTAIIENGKITYQLTKQLTGVEVLTYTVKATATSGVESDNKTTTAKVYIIPATSMYYEENFNGLVTFSDGWSDVGTAQTDPQEPGVVGTVGDSPYGSDEAYLNDSGDSNGSSKYVNTTNGEASFSYTFTGTGTSFFARTGSTAAYMRVVVKDENGQTISDTRRNNIYKAVDGTDVGTLYNVPVYTIDALDYGTYTVTVTLMKANEAISRGSTFYLDGIRVIKPLDSTDANASVADSAYAADGEANMTVVTLREKLIQEAQIQPDNTIAWNEGDSFVLFTDTNGSITFAEEYRSNGPKEEVYLNNGQSVSFSLTNWDPNTNKIYLGVKAPVGSGSVSVNGNTLSIDNATDCYYDISSYGTITTDENGINTATFKIEATSSLISVTNIKVTGNAEFTIVNQEEIIVDENTDDDSGTDENVSEDTNFSLKSASGYFEKTPSVEDPSEEPVSGEDDDISNEYDANVDDSPVSGDEPSDDDIIVDVTVE